MRAKAPNAAVAGEQAQRPAVLLKLIDQKGETDNYL